MICVAAADQNDNLASFSNYGGSVDLAAPGVDTTHLAGLRHALQPRLRGPVLAGVEYTGTYSPSGNYGSGAVYSYNVRAVATSPAASAARWPTTCAKRPCVVPNLVGAKLATAKARIKARHCRAGLRFVKSTRKKRGKVVKESPKAGKRLASGAKVNLWLGKAPARRR